MSRKAQKPLEAESAAQVDSYDLSIISAIAEDATISSKELSSRIHLSRTATARRVQNLLDKGLIETPRAKVDYKKLGFAIETTIQMK